MDSVEEREGEGVLEGTLEEDCESQERRLLAIEAGTSAFIVPSYRSRYVCLIVPLGGCIRCRVWLCMCRVMLRLCCFLFSFLPCLLRAVA